MSANPSPPLDVKPEFLFHALMRAHFSAQQAALSRQGLPNLGSPRILFALLDLSESGRPAPSQKELADLLHISPATATASLRSLEKYGYVSRRADEKDSRRNLIGLTEQGRTAVATSRSVFQSVDQYMFHGFTPEERRQVQLLHRRMLQNLYQIGGDRDACCPPPFSKKG